jgi:hypothetical protein
MSWKSFIEWNKKVFNDPEPLIAFVHHSDELGNEYTDIKLPFGSRFVRKIQITDTQINKKRMEMIRHE